MVRHTNQVDEVQAGDWKDIDEYVNELEEAGYTVSYKNHWAGKTGFFAEVSVNDITHAFFEGTPNGHIVRDVETKLSRIN